MILYSAAIFYNPLSFGKLYALSETILNIDELYNTKRPSDLSDSFSDKFNECKDNSLFCTIKTKVFDVKVLRNTYTFILTRILISVNMLVEFLVVY